MKLVDLRNVGVERLETVLKGRNLCGIKKPIYEYMKLGDGKEEGEGKATATASSAAPVYIGQYTYFGVKSSHGVASVCAASTSGEVGRAVPDIGHLVRGVILAGIWTRSVLAMCVGHQDSVSECVRNIVLTRPVAGPTRYGASAQYGVDEKEKQTPTLIAANLSMEMSSEAKGKGL